MANESSALLSVALQLTATRSLDALLPVVLEHLVDLTGAERALFALFDEGNRIEDAVVHNLAWEPGTDLPISRGIVLEVLTTGEMREVVNADLDSLRNVHESIRQYGLRFILAMPVFESGRVSGVLYADSRGAVRAEGDRRVEVIRALAGIVGIALENARLLDEQRARAMLLGKVVHDLRGPLTAVTLGVDVVRAAVRDPDVTPVLDQMAFAGGKMEAYCESALRLAGLDGAVDEPPPASIVWGELLARHARLFDRVAGQYGVSVVTAVAEGLPAVRTWPDRVGLTLDNLIFNALKHAVAGTVVSVTARRRDDAGPWVGRERARSAMAGLFRKVPCAEADPAGGWVEVSVHNRGAPIAPSLMPRIFEERVTEDHTGRGLRATGLGLAIVDQCVRSLGGRVWAESSADEGTTFRFTVPMAAR